MIERTNINGRDAVVVYLGDDFEPVREQKEASLVKVLFDDGEVLFLVPERKEPAR